MQFSELEMWAIIHGFVFGGSYLLAFTGGLMGFYSLRPKLLTTDGISHHSGLLQYGTIGMAVLIWFTATIGTFFLYPAYRAAPPEGIDRTVHSEELRAYPRYFLLADERTDDFHTFGMEWKEHVAWIAPMLATVVAYAVTRYRHELARHTQARFMVMVFFILSFSVVGIVGMLGALIARAAPVF